ncbi:DUF4259 domain-containing protein [Flavobacterium sp. KBS0721]|jgi:signal recognition particle GTPase|uniref:DUF4259 domain-containing protein n=1 Tax=Flavobacterium sp. KBS0721 TaxID=1179672 RepID=UPI00099006EC|nr:DUF4259 domain-containing protein [Flavobacterium sp. KBS0721]QDW19889.1 DUF4259 domain-containing protein [Flavobacterium sp. KBS0721]
MGAWDYGIFDDDTAYDFFDEIREDARTFFNSSFEKAINSDYLDYEDCHAVTVSAAYIDNFLNGTKFRNDNEDEEDETNVNLFNSLNKELILNDLKTSAVRALEKVISDNSELNELWSDNEELYPKWKQNIEDLIKRLKN